MSELDGYIEKAILLARSNKLRSGDSTIREGIKRVITDITTDLHAPDTSSISHLVHYTGIDVLFAMLDPNDDKGGLRLYDTVHANDPEEGRFLLRHWPDCNDRHPWMWQESANWTSDDNSGLPLSEQVEKGLYPGHAYVLSFVPSACDERNNDRIVFWREYGRQGVGCSLSIPKNKIIDVMKCSLVPYRVRYGRKEIMGLAERLDDCLFQPIQTRIRDVDGPERQLFEEAQLQVYKALQLFRYLYKDDAYDYEKENPPGHSGTARQYWEWPNIRATNKSEGRNRISTLHKSPGPSIAIKSSDWNRRVILGPTVPHG